MLLRAGVLSLFGEATNIAIYMINNNPLLALNFKTTMKGCAVEI